MNEPKISSCREALDITEGASLLVDATELQSLPAARVPGLPEGFQARRVRGDCVLIGWTNGSGCYALRLNSCTIKPRLVEMLQGRKPA